jgi:hypothetical protein
MCSHCSVVFLGRLSAGGFCFACYFLLIVSCLKLCVCVCVCFFFFFSSLFWLVLSLCEVVVSAFWKGLYMVLLC